MKKINKRLYLEDLSEMKKSDLVDHISGEYDVPKAEVAKFNILIAYESVGAYGCDSSSFFLLQDDKGNLYEVHGSHCSCYGFEGQWEPEPTTVEYLTSDKFYFNCGGHDGCEDENRRRVRDYLCGLHVGSRK